MSRSTIYGVFRLRDIVEKTGIARSTVRWRKRKIYWDAAAEAAGTG